MPGMKIGLILDSLQLVVTLPYLVTALPGIACGYCSAGLYVLLPFLTHCLLVLLLLLLACAPAVQVLSTMGSVVWREKLEEAVSAADAASSALVSDFMSGAVPLEQFIQKHVDMRLNHHALDLKRQAAEALLAGSGASGGGRGSS